MVHYFFALGAALLWGFSAAFSKLALQSLDVWQLIFFGSVLATVFFGSWLIMTKKIVRATQVLRKQPGLLLLLALLTFSYYALIYHGFTIGPTAETYIVNLLWVLLILPVSTLCLGERYQASNYGALLLGFLGAGIIITKLQFTEEISGAYFYAICAAFLYAYFSVLQRQVALEKPIALFWNFLLVAILSGLFLPVVSEFRGLYTLTELGSVFYVGFGSMALAFFCWLKALTAKQVVKIVQVLYLIPFFTIIAVTLILREPMDFLSLLSGTTLIVLGMFWQKAAVANFTKKN